MTPLPLQLKAIDEAPAEDDDFGHARERLDDILLSRRLPE